MRKALVTGASGFVGGHLINRLRQEGWHVRTISRNALENSDDHVSCDLTHLPLSPDLMRGIDVVFHLAAWQPGLDDPAIAHGLNVDATRALAQLAHQSSVQRFVFVSSTAAMGNVTSSPINETCECQPSSLYETTKREAELRLLEVNGLESVILRPPMIAGAGIKSGPLLKMMQLCQKGRFPVFGGKTDMAKPLVHVEDLVSAMLLASEKPIAGETFLITSGQSHLLSEIINGCAELLGEDNVTMPIPYGLARLIAQTSTSLFATIGKESPLSNERLKMFQADRRFDIAKARDLLGYEPKFTATMDLLRPTFDTFRKAGML